MSNRDYTETPTLIYWRDVFRVLGIRSCQPLLGRMGVSVEMAGRPEGLLRAANHFWQRDWQGFGLSGYSDPNFKEKYRKAIDELIKATFAIVSDQYGDEAAKDLYTWAQRFFINHDEQNLWSTWSLLLGPPAQLQAESQFQSEIDRFAESLEREFGSATYEADIAALNAIDVAKLSRDEYKMIALEVSRPGDFVTVDLRDLAGSVIRSNHAYQFWRVLSSSLDASELDTWLWIGYEQAEKLGMPVQDVQLPLIEN
ncbi:MAG TPA: hypothetical protein VFS76_23245 [Pyrinomonadaceae bacterium]|nr:hypothetical protein [Pyrinomonadaceae bacterium]